jgi:hypothetical protein
MKLYAKYMNVSAKAENGSSEKNHDTSRQRTIANLQTRAIDESDILFLLSFKALSFICYLVLEI